MCLIRVRETSHSRHDAENVVVGGIDTDLGGLGALNGGVRENELERSVVNAREVARARGLMFLGSQSKRIYVDALVGVARVGLVGLDPREVGSLTLREAILAVELELGNDDGVLAPTVEVKRRLRENEGAGIRDSGALVEVGGANKRRKRDARGGSLLLELHVVGVVRIRGIRNTGLSEGVQAAKLGSRVRIRGTIPVLREELLRNIESTGIVERALAIDVGVLARELSGATERVDGVGESVNGVRVVEGLGAENFEENRVAKERRAVINVLIGLDNPDKLLHRVVEVELDLVGRRTNRLVTRELELGDQVLVGVLGKAAALVRIQKDVIDVERRGHKRLVVRNDSRHRGARASRVGLRGADSNVVVAVQAGDGPQALVNRANVEVNLDLVVLKSDQGKGKTGVRAEPELEGDVQRGLGKGIAGSTNLARGEGVARTIDVGERGIRDEGELSGVTNHLEVATLLLRGHRELVPDVHPITVLAIDALATNLNLNLSDELLAGEIKPAGIYAGGAAGESGSVSHELVNLGESNLKIRAVGKIAVAADNASNATTEIGLTVESLLDRFNSKVSVASVGYLPEGNLRVSSKIDILSAIGDELHKTTSHFYNIAKEKNF